MADPSIGGAPVPGGFGAGPAVGGGFGFPGLGGGFGLDGGIGGIGGGLFGGGLPFGGGYAPYIPVTPLGALGGYKGDLLVPIVVVGVAIFLLLIIVLAVKAALAWKLDILDNLAGTTKFSRSLPDNGPIVNDPDQMASLTNIVLSALESEGCLDKIICQVGAFGRGTSWPSYFSMIENLIPQDYKQSLSLLKSSAQSVTSCDNFKCGSQAAQSSTNQPQNSSGPQPIKAPMQNNNNNNKMNAQSINNSL